MVVSEMWLKAMSFEYKALSITIRDTVLFLSIIFRKSVQNSSLIFKLANVTEY